MRKGRSAARKEGVDAGMKCEDCGMEFPYTPPKRGGAKKRFCPECRAERQRALKRKQRDPELYGVYQPRRARTDSMSEISRIAAEARSQGLSYGEYVRRREPQRG